MASVTFDGVSKVYDNGFVAVDNLDLEIRDGEFMVLVGPSGCGKTTALRMLAGLEDISTGDLVIDDTRGQRRRAAEARHRDGLPELRALSAPERVRQHGLRAEDPEALEGRDPRAVREIAGVIGLEELLERKPKALSGGQRQRVAMGRAIVRKPKVFLMDEPLSNLDAKLRVQMRSEVARIQHELKATTVYVTHDQVEAMTMGDRVALMRRGVLQQVDTPMRLYNAPANLFVASFIGSPAMNLFEAQLSRRNGNLVAQIGDQLLRLAPEALADPASSSATTAAPSPSACGRSTSRTPRSPPARRRSGACAAPSAASRRSARNSSRTSSSKGKPVMTEEVKEVAADTDATVVHELEAEARDAMLPVVGRFDERSRARPDQADRGRGGHGARSTSSTSTRAPPSGAIPSASTTASAPRPRKAEHVSTASPQAGTPPSPGPRRPGAPGSAPPPGTARRASRSCSCSRPSSGSWSSTPSRRCAAST